jgi:integrase
LAIYTGLRNGELYALKWDRIDLENNLIKVDRSWNNKDGFKSTKSGHDRLVDIAPELRTFLLDLKLKTTHTSFVLPRIGRWDKGEQARELQMFLIALGLPVIRFHDLRATWCTLMLSRGVEPAKVMAMAGWKEFATMDRYIREAGIDIKGACSVLKIHDSKANLGGIVKFKPIEL